MSSSPAQRRGVCIETFQNAALSIGNIAPGMSLFGVTRGQFSMIDVLMHLLDQVGTAEVSVWTWTVASYEIECFTNLMRNASISRGTLVIDDAARNKNSGLIEEWRGIFGPGAVRYVRNHAKIATVQTSEYRLLIRGSMNLNYNPRFEQFDITEGGPDFDLVKQMEGELPDLPADCSSQEVSRATKLDRAFDTATLDLFRGMAFTELGSRVRTQWDSLMGSAGEEGLIAELLGDDQEAAARLRRSMAMIQSGMASGRADLQREGMGLVLEQLGSLSENSPEAAKLVGALLGEEQAKKLSARTMKALAGGLMNGKAALGEFSGALDRANAKTNTARQTWQEAGRSFQMAAQGGIGVLLETVEPASNFVLRMATGFAGFLEQHPNVAAMGLGLIGLAGGLAGVGAGIAGIGVLVPAYKVGMAAMGHSTVTLTGSLWGMAAAGWAAIAPWLPFIGVAALVGTSAALIYKNFDEMVRGVKLLWLDLTSLFTGVDWSGAGTSMMERMATGITTGIMFPYHALMGGLHELRQLLPFSDAEVGPLSELTASGAAIPETLAEGLRGSTGQLQKALDDLAVDAPNLSLGVTGGASGGAASPMQISLTQHIEVNTGSADGTAVEAAVMSALRKGSSELLWELERAMSEIMRRRAATA